MGKIRPKRIIEGWKNHLTGKIPEFSELRYETCMSCEHKKQIVGGYICGICKCPLKAKTKVADEVCPANNWHDIKEFPEQGIAVRIHDAEKVYMTVEGEKIVIEYVDDLILNSNPNTSKFKFSLINLRGDYDGFEDNEIDIELLKAKICSCFEVRYTKNKIGDGDSLDITAMYNTKIPGEIHKHLSLVTNVGTYKILFKGNVIEE